MEEKNIMTFQELIDYADESKANHEKQRLEQDTERNKICWMLVKSIIDKLNYPYVEFVPVEIIDDYTFCIGGFNYNISVRGVGLEDIKEVIDAIPALEAKFNHKAGNSSIIILEVEFSKPKANKSKQ